MLAIVFIGLMVAGAIGFLTRSRGPALAVPGSPYAVSRDAAPSSTVSPDSASPYGTPATGGSGASGADARAEAVHWVDLLGAGLSNLSSERSEIEHLADESRSRAARFALTDAAERHTAATRDLARAQTPVEIDLAGRTAIEGLHHLRAARTALGLDPGPEPPSTDTTARVTAPQQVTIGGEQYEASAEATARTPYYYPGGTVRGTTAPAAWYSTPWWKTALVAGAAGMGSLLLIDTLFGHHGGFGGPGMGGMGGPMNGGMGPMDGGFF